MRRLLTAIIGIALLAGACTVTQPESPATSTRQGPTTTKWPDTRQLSEGLEVAVGGSTLTLGVAYLYRFGIHCGTRYIWELNGTNWETDEVIHSGTGRWADDLRQFFTNPNEAISPELRTHLTLVAEDELLLTLPDGSLPSTYRPTGKEPIPCA